MNKCNIKLICIFLGLIIIFSFAGCKKEKTVSSNPTDTSVLTAKTDDTLDPENNEYNNESGTKVKAEELEVKSGKANGIDVSKWQGKINWSAVKKSGIDFAIIRIGYRGENGVIYKDANADYNIQQADKAGLLVGVYFFSTAINASEAKEEATFTANAIAGYPISYPVVYNCEGFKNPESRMSNLSNSQRTDNALAFLSVIKAKGYEAMFYASKNELDNSAFWDTPRIENQYMVWVARYPEIPYPTMPSPDYSGKYDMWQYTDKGTVNGITGNTDMIVSYFTREKAAAKNEKDRPKNAEAPHSDENIYTYNKDKVTPKIEVNLRESATTKGNVIASVKNGTALNRVATGTNGWSKIEYGGKTVYAISSYLTTDLSYKPPAVSDFDEFKPATGKFTAKDETRLRAEPNTQCEIIATIKNGEFVTRTGIGKTWTRLEYKGKTVYARSDLLTTEINNTPKNPEPPPPVSDDFVAASGKVTAKEDVTNLRTAPSTENTKIVHQLRKGEFVTLVGKSPKGWSKLNYEGQTVYAVTSYLLTEEEYNKQLASSTTTSADNN